MSKIKLCIYNSITSACIGATATGGDDEAAMDTTDGETQYHDQESSDDDGTDKRSSPGVKCAETATSDEDRVNINAKIDASLNMVVVNNNVRFYYLMQIAH